MANRRALAVLFAWSICLFSTHTLGSAGDLDLTFGGTGKVVTTLASYHFNGFVAVQPDGRIVTGGTVAFDGAVGVDTYFAFTRHFANGAPDTSFGDNGHVIDFAGSRGSKLNAITLQPDGRIVAVGAGVLIRYNADGSRDATFGSNGVVTTSLPPLFAEFKAVAVQPDKSIVVAGETVQVVVNGDSPIFFALARYTENGSLDPSFGVGGVTTTAFDLKASANALALTPDGRIVVGGYSRVSGIAPTSIALARYTSTGTLDTTFGTGGKSIAHPVDPETYISAAALSLQPNGKIVTVGDSSVVRFLENGLLDTSFGLQGVAGASFGPITTINSIVIQPDSKIVVAGTVQSPTAFVVARYSPTGELDKSFGVGGATVTRIGAAAAANSVALQSDGKIIVSGIGDGGNDFALARYLSDSKPASAIPAISPANLVWLCLILVAMAFVQTRAPKHWCSRK